MGKKVLMTSCSGLASFRRTGGTFRPALEPVDKIQVADPYTLRITTRGPTPTLIDRLADRYPKMLSRKAFERGVNFEREPMGTGPFKLANWDRRSGATLVRNDAYWDPAKPYLDKIQLWDNVPPGR